ncbi:UDP-galactopyranose mutase [Nitzschia inconspicua]|uniref:UDP-galactopyranose mutase n=1 Tax=Nitzschia inconspicua TaxID=303405 RepID=A0A9K3KFP2_9STRA|nr:UDP-galactopyranose mutase [Nitzschia inconspicua]KAG7371710.1 UDP-galactopyranose mutase [Nitzschia inconspicua]
MLNSSVSLRRRGITNNNNIHNPFQGPSSRLSTISRCSLILLFITACFNASTKDFSFNNWRESSSSSAASSHSNNKKGLPQSVLQQQHDICVVGAGLSGAVIAERYATQLNQKVLIVEKRGHIGGNCYDFLDPQANVRISKYGAHLFHTKHERVWEYVQQFSEWTPYEHKVIGLVNNTHVPIPVNIDTVNTLFGLQLTNSQQMDQWLAKEQVKYDHEPSNAEEVALSRVGPRLYDLIFKPYTKKQWDRDPKELGPEVTARIPVRNDFDGRYFSDPYQALPKRGYTAIFERMFHHPNIQVYTNVDYFDVRSQLDCGRTYYTGPIDTYFADLGWEKLQYRSLTFERQFYKNKDFFQPAFVVNHPYESADFTRIVEYKHLPDQPKSPHTVIFVERSSDVGEPYYPIPNQRNKDLFRKYQDMANKEPKVTFVGRLANYKYFNMDDAILNALELFDQDTQQQQKQRQEKAKTTS